MRWLVLSNGKKGGLCLLEWPMCLPGSLPNRFGGRWQLLPLFPSHDYAAKEEVRSFTKDGNPRNRASRCDLPVE